MVRQIGKGPSENPHSREFWTGNRSSSQSQFFERGSASKPPSVSYPQTDDLLHVDTALKERCGIEDFAIVFLNTDGRACTHTSSSLQDLKTSMFTTHIDNILHRATRTIAHGSSYPSAHGRNDDISNFSHAESSYHRRQSISSSPIEFRPGFRQSEMLTDDIAPIPARKRHRGLQLASRYVQNAGSSSHKTIQSKQLMLSNHAEVRKFLDQRFKDLQQSACKMCGKAFVKKIEPKKQTNYPYTGRELKAPKWWPLPTEQKKGVRHREPDHLLKPERVHLLVHIILLVARPAAEKPESMRDVDIKELDAHTTEYMQAWFSDRDHPENQKKLPFLREIFKVARSYERFLNGELDETASVMVSHGDSISDVDDEADEGHQYDDEDELAPVYTPVSSMASPRENIVSPLHSQTNLLQEPRNEGASYYLPVRPYQQQLPTPTEDVQYQDSTSHFRTSQPSDVYSSSVPAMFTPSTMRRSSQWMNQAPLNVAPPTTTHFSSTAGSPFPNQWPASTSGQVLSYGNSYTTNQPQSSHGVLPPPTQMLQQHGTTSYNNHLYMPPPPHENLRTCVLPGPPQNFTQTGHGQYGNYLEEKLEDQYEAPQTISHR